jgi:HlyD family secretion protein
MRTLIVAIFLIVAATAAGGWYWHNGGRSDMVYKTAPVQRGDLVSTITATGTLEPEEVIDVGAQVAGLIESFGADSNGKSIDYRSPVEPGMVLARIDDTVYKADVNTAEAQLGQAKTSVQKSQADLLQANAKLLQAEHNWNRAKTMGSSDALSQNDYDMYQADYETAKANVAVVVAQIESAKNSVLQAQAELDKAQRNLDFCTIKSPVKGVIIDRRVNIGQTVVSSLNAPSLFLIAQDLTRMQIWVAVNEADVGRIQPDMPVTFTCDAFPDQTFEGKVGKVRLNATMTQNVVMYTVEVEADNPKNILLPYLTAKVEFEVQRERDTLTVPNAALRWYPTSMAQVTPAARSSWTPITEPAEATTFGPPSNSSKPEKSEKSGKQKKHQSTTKPTAAVRHGTVWVKDGEFVRPVNVKLGLTDGISTAISADENNSLQGSEVVVGQMTQQAADSEAQKNPFLPQMRRR